MRRRPSTPTSKTHVAYLLSDGNGIDGKAALSAAENASMWNLMIHTVGYDHSNHSLLYRMVAKINGNYCYV
jgi:hypothetical protein